MFYYSDYCTLLLWLTYLLLIVLQASRYIPDIHVVRAIQKIVWASGCGSLELVFRPNEDISETYEMVRIRTETIVL